MKRLLLGSAALAALLAVDAALAADLEVKPVQPAPRVSTSASRAAMVGAMIRLALAAKRPHLTRTTSSLSQSLSFNSVQGCLICRW